jgi:hypothetical protein
VFVLSACAEDTLKCVLNPLLQCCPCRLDFKPPVHFLRPRQSSKLPFLPALAPLQSSCQSASTGNGAVTASTAQSESANGAPVPILEPGTVGERLADAAENGVSTFKARVLDPEELFFVSEADGTDLDQPTPGFSSIREAVEAIKKGQVRCNVEPNKLLRATMRLVDQS